MCKKGDTPVQEIVAARQWADAMVQRESRGSGDLENAMRRLETRYGIPWRTFWMLRYRPPHDIAASIFMKLFAAYRAECERQMRQLRHELEITEAIAGPAAAAVRAAQALVDEKESAESE